MVGILGPWLLLVAAPGPGKAREQNAPGWIGAPDTGLCDRAERIALPETNASVRIPAGYVCSSEGNVFFENVNAHILECLPKHGGTALELQKEIGSRVPRSLSAYVSTLAEGASNGSRRTTVLAPHAIRIAGRNAVESAAKGTAFFDGPSGGSKGELLTHTFEIEDQSGFYACSSSTTPGQYSKALQQRLHDFCDSIAF